MKHIHRHPIACGPSAPSERLFTNDDRSLIVTQITLYFKQEMPGLASALLYSGGNAGDECYEFIREDSILWTCDSAPRSQLTWYGPPVAHLEPGEHVWFSPRGGMGPFVADVFIHYETFEEEQ